MEGRLELYRQKNELYGDSFAKTFGQYGPISALTRMRDKLDRLETLILNPNLDSRDESIIDTLNDLANYCDMTIEVMTDGASLAPDKTEKKAKKSRKKKKVKTEKAEKAEKPASPLDGTTKDRLVEVAKSLGLVTNSRTSTKVLTSMIEKEFDTPEDLAKYLEGIKDSE